MPSSRDTPIQVADLSFDYVGRTVLNDIRLSVGAGKIVGLLGPNGSGKSTLLKIIAGTLPGYRGSVQVAGVEVRSFARGKLARLVAMVQQEPEFSFNYSVLEIVLMGRHPHLAGLAFESAADVEIAHAALDRCGILALGQRPIHELSSGERQRVVFARALAQEPMILLLDEPASFLDIRHQVEIFDIVRELAEVQGCAVLTAVHDLNLAAEYFDQVYLLSDRTIAACGSSGTVLNYANLTRVFETELYVDTNTLTGKLLIVPLSGRSRRLLAETRAPRRNGGHQDS